MIDNIIIINKREPKFDLASVFVVFDLTKILNRKRKLTIGKEYNKSFNIIFLIFVIPEKAKIQAN